MSEFFPHLLGEEATEPEEPIVYTVSQLTRLIRVTLEETFPTAWVAGEISGFKHHSSGHMYFDLKDDAAVLRCVMFRQANEFLRFEPENGLEVLASGQVSVYPRWGQYQLVVRDLRPKGMGVLELAFRQLKEKLEKEGLFDPARKRPLPSFPAVVGVATSLDGAAIRDIVTVIRRRAPGTELLIAPCRVQGDGATEEIVAALGRLGRDGRAEVVIVGRGGGSMEDLWAFNEEAVARAIAACPIPVVSAVGHEVDVTIADLVADLRAPTPSAAAELVVPDQEALRVRVEDLARGLMRGLRQRIRGRRDRIHALLRSHGLRSVSSRWAVAAQSLDQARHRLLLAAARGMERWREALRTVAESLEILSPLETLARGYALVFQARSGHLVRQADQLDRGEAVLVQLSRGRLDCRVEEVRPEVALDETLGESS